MQNFNAEQKPKHTVRNAIFALLGIGVLIFAGMFAAQVLSIRNQILSGEYNVDAYGAQTSGSGGANYDTSGRYDVATDDDPSIGPANADVTIVEFSDFECPFCRQSYPIIRSLVQEFKDEVRFVYRDFPLVAIHDNAHTAARAGFCADKQDLFWQLHDKLFQNQDAMGKTAILGYANQIG
ncbi:MAG: DsbA family protein, partial [bacterium]|nr:DsbA family protein [bacterium]